MSVQENQTSFTQRYRSWRRQVVYKAGEKFTRVVSGFFSSQGLVEDKPFLNNASFPFLQMFSDNWEKIRDEVQVILKNREAIPAFQEVSPDQHLIAKVLPDMIFGKNELAKPFKRGKKTRISRFPCID